MTDYKAIAAFLGEPYFLGDTGIYRHLDKWGGHPCTDADLVIAALEKLARGRQRCSLAVEFDHYAGTATWIVGASIPASDGPYATLWTHFRGPTPIEAISALVVAMKESA